MNRCAILRNYDGKYKGVKHFLVNARKQNTISEMENVFDRLITRLEILNKRISEFKKLVLEITQTERQEERQKKIISYKH